MLYYCYFPGLTVLHLAALQGHTQMARGLLYAHKKCHVHVDAVDNQGMTALHTACARGHYDIAKMLVYEGKATQTKRDNVYFRSPAEWLQTSLEVHTDIDPFPPKLQRTRDWQGFTANRLLKHRNPVKTAPCLSIPKPEQIRLALSPVDSHRETKPRCKSAQITRSREPFEETPVKSKTFVLTSPVTQPERTSTAKEDKKSPQRLRSAPPRLSPTNKVCKNVSIKSSQHDLSEITENSKQKDEIITPKEILRHIYDVYTLQISSSYRREAIAPPVLTLSDLHCSNLSLEDCSSARPTSADRKSCSSGKARFQRVVRMRRAESILKSLKGIQGKRNSLSGSMTSVHEVNE